MDDFFIFIVCIDAPHLLQSLKVAFRDFVDQLHQLDRHESDCVFALLNGVQDEKHILQEVFKILFVDIVISVDQIVLSM